MQRGVMYWRWKMGDGRLSRRLSPFKAHQKLREANTCTAGDNFDMASFYSRAAISPLNEIHMSLDKIF